MKIYFITSKLNFRTAGGSIEEFDVMIKELTRLGNEVTAVTMFSRDNDIPDPLPYPIIEERITSSRLIPIQWQCLRILRKYEKQADFFHIDGHLFMYAGGLYRCLGGKVPVSAYFNRELSVWSDTVSTLLHTIRVSFFTSMKKSIRRLIEKYFLMPLTNGIDIILVTNPVLLRAYEAFGLNKKSPRLILGDPLYLKKKMLENNITEESYRLRNKRNGPVVLFYSSRMAPGKGFDLLVSAFSKLKDKSAYRLILGGTGPEELQIKAMIERFNLSPYVEMPGWVSKEQLYGFYKKADIFIQARWRVELTSISLLYAMAFGIPSILPKGGGLEWDAKDSALHFKDMDADDLAKQIERLGSNPDLREQLSRACYARLSEDEMNPEKQVALWHNLMQATLKRTHTVAK